MSVALAFVGVVSIAVAALADDTTPVRLVWVGQGLLFIGFAWWVL